MGVRGAFRQREAPLHQKRKEDILMSTSNRNLQGLFQQGVDAGTVTADSLAKLNDLGAEIEQALGIDAQDIPASEVMLLTMEIDDTGSIQGAGNEADVRKGCNTVLDEVGKSTMGDDILVSLQFLIDGLLFPYTQLKSATHLDARNYRADGSHTPLFDRSMVVLGAVLAKEQEFANQGVPVRTVTVIVTDGADNSSKARASDVAKLVKGMLQAENHIIAFIGVSDGSVDFRQVARDMGIQDQWVLTPNSDGHSIRDAFGLVSRASQAASQASANLSQIQQSGFGQGIA